MWTPRYPWRTGTVAALATTLAVSLLTVPAHAEPEGTLRPKHRAPVSVPGTTALAPRPAAQPSNTESAALRQAPAVSWQAKLTAPPGVRAEVLDQAQARLAGVNGLLVRAHSETATDAEVEVDYSQLRHAYGGGWASRLQVVRLSDGLIVPSRNDVKNGRLHAELPLPGPGRGQRGRQNGTESATTDNTALFAVIAAAAGANGNFQATTLPPSLTWQVGLNSGDFGWSYPIDVPDLPGLTPTVALNYSSSSVDGRMAATNNQPSIVGEGFEPQAGFIERSYQSCKEDGHATSRELCFASNNATISLPGIGGELVRDDVTKIWRSEEDAGWRVELLTDQRLGNGDNDGEYWKLTSPDGTVYFFGRSAAAKSAWTVPVFGDDFDEPCYQATFANAWCVQAYRWNLDYVVNVHGDAMAYYYDTETNFYNRGSYVRAGQLNRIEYGFRDGAATPAAGRVRFVTEGRCIPGTTCDPATAPKNFPDTPLDQQCTSTSCLYPAPTFWTTKRLAKIITQVRHNGDYRDVNSWTLAHTFPSNGDDNADSPGLWLQSITRTGHVGEPLTLPPVTFDGVLRENRVDGVGQGLPYKKWRLAGITNETGGRIDVTYSDALCNRGALPVPDGNTQTCYPGFWTRAGETEPRIDWFQKYVVTQVVERDLTGSGNVAEVTQYEYLGGAGWVYDNSELTPARFKSWGQYRGFQRTRVKHGDPALARQTVEEHLFLRGMDNDLLSTGARRDVWVADSLGGTIEDQPVRRGFTRETTTFTGSEWMSRTISQPLEIRKTASRARPVGALEAYLTEERSEREYTRHPGGVWITETIYGYDDYGRVVSVDDRGDVSRDDDDRCVLTAYTQNESLWILDTEASVRTLGVRCELAPAATPADLLSEERYYYDRATSITAVPTKGNLTGADEAASPGVHVSKGTAVYDDHGRATEVTDPSGDRSTQTFTPASGGPVTSVTAANALGHTVTTTFDPLLGLATSNVDANGLRSDQTYDALGRLTAGWAPGRSKAAGQSASAKFAYPVRATGLSVVSSSTLLSNGTYLTSHALLDGFLRTRQTQSPSVAGGRLVADTWHDSQGRVVKTNATYWNNDSGPATSLLLVGDEAVPAQTRYLFDDAGRETAEILVSHNVEKWRTTTSYGPNWTAVDPPQGATPTMEFFDLEGRIVELRQFHGAGPSGGYDATKYAYDKAGRKSGVTDPAGNVWRQFYDLRGRKVRDEDPDSGVATFTYDNEDQLTSTTDSRGITLTSTYDALGRKTALLQGTTRLAEWTFDTLPNGKGLPVADIRYAGTSAYRNEITGYQAGTGRVLGTRATIPAGEQGLAGTYTTTYNYNSFGLLTSTVLPSVPGLPAETLTHGYNAFDLPATVTGLATYIAATWYDEFGRNAGNLHGTSGKQVWSGYLFDPATGRLEQATTDREDDNEPSVSWVNYAYDQAGNVTSSSDATAGDQQCFSYDYLRRLTEAWTPSSGDCATARSSATLGGPAGYWHSYTYDKTGNRLSETRHAAAGDTNRSYTYPAAGTAQPHALKSVATTGPGVSRTDTYTYDAAGNTLTRLGQTLTWDAEGRLATSGGTSLLYDADGDRLIRRDTAGATLYLPGLEIRRTSGGTTSTRYYGTYAVRTASGLSWLVSDHQGTANISVNAATLAVTRRYQTPFGQPRGTSVTWPSERGFVGGTNDPTLGTVHLGAREYDPGIGRFLSVDPIIDDADPQQMHGYAYAENNPVTKSDPDGLKSRCQNPRQCDGSNAKINRDAERMKQRAAAERARKAARERAWVKSQRDRHAAALKAAKAKAAREKAAQRAREKAAQKARDKALAKCGGSIRACQNKDDQNYKKKVCYNKASCENYERRFNPAKRTGSSLKPFATVAHWLHPAMEKAEGFWGHGNKTDGGSGKHHKKMPPAVAGLAKVARTVAVLGVVSSYGARREKGESPESALNGALLEWGYSVVAGTAGSLLCGPVCGITAGIGGSYAGGAIADDLAKGERSKIGKLYQQNLKIRENCWWCTG